MSPHEQNLRLQLDQLKIAAYDCIAIKEDQENKLKAINARVAQVSHEIYQIMQNPQQAIDQARQMSSDAQTEILPNESDAMVDSDPQPATENQNETPAPAVAKVKKSFKSVGKQPANKKRSRR